MSVTVKIKGLKKTRNVLRKAGRLLDKKILKNTAMAATEPVLKDAVMLAPVRTGELQDALKKKSVPQPGPRALVKVAVDYDVAFYGHFPEFGTVKMAARPFMLPSFDKNEQVIDSIVWNTLRMALKRI